MKFIESNKVVFVVRFFHIYALLTVLFVLFLFTIINSYLCDVCQGLESVEIPYFIERAVLMKNGDSLDDAIRKTDLSPYLYSHNAPWEKHFIGLRSNMTYMNYGYLRMITRRNMSTIGIKKDFFDANAFEVLDAITNPCKYTHEKEGVYDLCTYKPTHGVVLYIYNDHREIVGKVPLYWSIP